MTAIDAQTERKRHARSVRCDEKQRCRPRTEPLSGLFCPVSAARPTAGVTRGKKRLSSGPIQAIFAAEGTPLGERRTIGFYMHFDRLILHIGRHKSGTSSLQHWLSNSRQQLSAQGVLYPFSGSDNKIAHHFLAGQLNTRKSAGEALNEILTGIKQEEKGERVLLISSEAFQNIKETTRLKEFIEELNIKEVEVVCYVREHLDYAISAYRQMVHAKTTFQTFAEYCVRFRDTKPFMSRWKDVGNLQLAWYDRSLLVQGDVISDFCHRVGIKGQSDLPLEKNPSIGGNLLAYKLAANRAALKVGTYNSLSRLASVEPRFRTAFHIEDSDAELVRVASAYNQSLFEEIGEIALKSWSNEPVVPDVYRLEEDLELICEHLRQSLQSEVSDAIREVSSWLSPKGI